MAAAKHSYHHGDLRRALIDRAVELISQKGASAFTLREVARRAGVSHTAPYRHFADKDALLAAVAEEGFRALHQRSADAAQAASEHPMLRFASAGETYVLFAIDKPAHFKVMFAGVGLDDEALRTAADAAFEQLVDEVLIAQRAGVIRQGDARSIALASWSMVHGLATLVVDGALPEDKFGGPEQIRAAIVPLIFSGIGAS